MSSPYQQSEIISEEKESIAGPNSQGARTRNKIPRIEAKDLAELSKSWYPQKPARVIINDKEPLFHKKDDKAQTAASVASIPSKISEDWEIVEHDDANDHLEEVSASGKVTRSVTTGLQ